MKNARSQLDEMLEQKMLRIERYGFWIAYWGLVICMLAQLAFLDGAGLSSIKGELVLFVTLSIYMLVSYLHHGLWGRTSSPEAKHTVRLSFCIGLSISVLRFMIHSIRGELTSRTLAFDVLLGVSGMIICFLVVNFLGFLCRRKQEKLENDAKDQ